MNTPLDAYVVEANMTGAFSGSFSAGKYLRRRFSTRHAREYMHYADQKKDRLGASSVSPFSPMYPECVSYPGQTKSVVEILW